MKKVKSDKLFGDIYQHPSFGQLSFAQSQGTGTALFGSSIKHRDTILMTIRKAEYNRQPGREYIFGREVLIEAMLSHTQFADAIAGVGSGSNVPITLRYIKGKGKLPYPEYINKRKQFESEFLTLVEGIMERLTNLETQSTNKKLPKWLTQELKVIRNWLKSNVPYLAERFDDQMDKSVTEAKGEIEAYVSSMVHKIGLEAIKKQAPQLPLGKGDDNEAKT